MRKTQQDEVYAAERLVRKGRRFDSQAAIQRWVDEEIVDTPWWHERFPQVITIECPTVNRQGTSGSVGKLHDDGVGQIEMHPNHWRELYVCHEIAHVTADAEGSTAHDPIFMRHYLELVYRMMGSEVWMELRQSMIDHGVVIDPRDDE